MRKEHIIPTIGHDYSYGEFLYNIMEWESPFPSTLFHINRLEDYVKDINFPLPPHRKTENDMILITKGKSIRSKGLNNYNITKNQFFFSPAYQVTSHEYMSEDVEGFFISYPSEVLGDFSFVLKKYPFLNVTAHPIVEIPEKAMPTILKLIYSIEDIYSNWKKDDIEVIIFYFLALLAEINKHTPEKTELKPEKNTAAILTEKYKNALSQHIYEKQTVQEYADLLFVTSNHLNKCVKNTLNKTAKSLLNEMLTLESKSLLKHTNLSISEIAHKLCRSTNSNFSRFFKQQTGITPKQYAQS